MMAHARRRTRVVDKSTKSATLKSCADLPGFDAEGNPQTPYPCGPGHRNSKPFAAPPPRPSPADGAGESEPHGSREGPVNGALGPQKDEPGTSDEGCCSPTPALTAEGDPRWLHAAENVGDFRLEGFSKVTLEPGEFVDESDTLDAIRHMTKSWRTAKKWRAGYGEKLVLKYSDGKDDSTDGGMILVMELMDTSHRRHKFQAPLTNLCMIANEGPHLGFLQRNFGKNVLSKKALPEQDGYVAVVCRAASEEDARRFAEDMRHLVTEAVVINVKERRHRASFHPPTQDALLAESFAKEVYGYDVPEKPGLVDETALWYRGKLKRGDSVKLRAHPEVQDGDFYIRESSQKGMYTLTVVVNKDANAVAHFRVVAKNADNPLTAYCYLEGHEAMTFGTLRELVEHYDSTGLGEVRRRKVQLLRAMGHDGKGSALDLKIARMNAAIKRGFNF